MKVYQDELATLLHGDVLAVLREMPAESVHCVVTSPPYFALRDYGTATWEGGAEGCDHLMPPGGGTGATGLQRDGRTEAARQGNATRIVEDRRQQYRSACGRCGAVRSDSQIGLEESPDAYVSRMVEVFREVRRVLRSDGTCWLNLGDSYAASGVSGLNVASRSDTFHGGTADARQRERSVPSGLKPKDLIGIPWRVALALQADGWWLRSEITWCKRAPMPESVTDRPTSATEKVFLLAKSERYFYDADAVREDASTHGRQRSLRGDDTGAKNGSIDSIWHKAPSDRYDVQGRNQRNYWLLGPEPYAAAHFATFPTEIPRRAILAGTSERGCCGECGAPWVRVVEVERRQIDGHLPGRGKGRRLETQTGGIESSGLTTGLMSVTSTTTGWRPTCDHDAPRERCVVPCTVLDPFIGSGTTCMVAKTLGRQSIGIDLNAEYLKLAERRLWKAAYQPGFDFERTDQECQPNSAEPS